MCGQNPEFRFFFCAIFCPLTDTKMMIIRAFDTDLVLKLTSRRSYPHQLMKIMVQHSNLLVFGRSRYSFVFLQFDLEDVFFLWKRKSPDHYSVSRLAKHG